MRPPVRKQPAYVYTSPETPAGKYLRSFWQPVALSRTVAPGDTARIRVLHDEFTLFRGDDGVTHVVAARCAHRGALLSLGRVEGHALRCMYHGWAYDGAGRCVDQPAEPEPFCQKVAIASYPTHEQAGLVFAYFGGGDPPALPHLPIRDEWVVETQIIEHPCNYFQRAENNVDGAHVQFVHGTAPELGTSLRATKGIPTAVETSFGLTFSLTFPNGGVEHNHFLMPNSAYVSLKPGNAPGRVHFRWWYVPIDDEHHYVVSLCFIVEDDWRKKWVSLPSPGERLDFGKELADVLAGTKSFKDRRLAGATHPSDVIFGQDAVVTCSLGPIADRTNERLGRTDVGVILLRKLWSREIELALAGKPATAPSGLPAEFPVFSEA
jgi:5,5'-dehydrodivanillate O-demethylase